jgi:hypothetical protein
MTGENVVGSKRSWTTTQTGINDPLVINEAGRRVRVEILTGFHFQAKLQANSKQACKLVSDQDLTPQLPGLKK